MGLLSAVLGLPLAPVRAVISLGEVIQRRAEEEMYSPASVRRDLEAIEGARAAGEISAEEETELQQQVLNRLTQPVAGTPDNAEEG